MRLRLCVFMVLACGTALGAVPDSPFVLPKTPPPSVPAPVPGSVPKLVGEYLCVINSKTDASVRGYPAGLVKIEKKKGPRDITARFVDGTGAVEDRTYEGPFVFVVRATGKGRIDLVLTPLGWKVESDIESYPLDVDSGTGPPPKPDVTPDPLLERVQAAFTADTGTTKTADKSSLAAVYQVVGESLGDVKTAGDLFAIIKGATEARIAGRLKPVRSIFGDELAKTLPTDPTKTLTPTQKVEVTNLLNRFATVLGGVK